MSEDTKAGAVAAVLAEFTRPTRVYQRSYHRPPTNDRGEYLVLDTQALAAEVVRLRCGPAILACVHPPASRYALSVWGRTLCGLCGCEA